MENEQKTQFSPESFYTQEHYMNTIWLFNDTHSAAPSSNVESQNDLFYKPEILKTRGAAPFPVSSVVAAPVYCVSSNIMPYFLIVLKWTHLFRCNNYQTIQSVQSIVLWGMVKERNNPSRQGHQVLSCLFYLNHWISSEDKKRVPTITVKGSVFSETWFFSFLLNGLLLISPT